MAHQERNSCVRALRIAQILSGKCSPKVHDTLWVLLKTGMILRLFNPQSTF